MTNSLPMPTTICCPPGSAGNLMPLLLVAVILFTGHIAYKVFKKRRGEIKIKNLKNISIMVLVIIAVGLVFALKQDRSGASSQTTPASAEVIQTIPDTSSPVQPTDLPRLVDLGAEKCIPCKMMAPILDELKTTYAGQLKVEFIDVWKTPDAEEPYNIRSIPTQIFYDASNKELFRHEGFFGKEDILVKWRELGYEFQ